MITAIVLINVERTKLREVVKDVLAIDGVSELHTVAGEYDLAAIVRVKDNLQLSDIVVNKMPHNIPGIIHTKTLVSLQSQSKIDIDAVFGMKNS
ncbi:MAG TPA: Lrp/AsnC ligand binding domain-containing protein [Victivallales bacterium]|nr:Lrp/AsnC ligand binding domain-containing protein [Victivallales bacterium]